MENIWTYCKSAINRFSSTKLWVVALCLFLLNLVGYTGFRYSISDDIFGGDTVNTVVNVMDSYALKESNLIGDPVLLYKMLLEDKNGDPQTDRNAFVYNLLSHEGKKVIERLIKDSTDERDKEIFLLEFNRAIVEKEINWPRFSSDIPVWLEMLTDVKANINIPMYNLQVLSRLYPNNIRENTSPLYQWKYDLSSMVRAFPKVFIAYFTINTPTRYSPLTNIYVTTVQMYLQNSPERTIAAIALTGVIYSTLIVLVFLLAEKLTKSVGWSLFAAFIFQASVSTIQSTYQLFSLPYMFVPLVMAGAVYAYLQYKDSGKVAWLMLFFYLSILAPWFREFPGVIPFIVFASEALSFRGRRSVVILILCAFLMIHSIYPTLLPWLIGLNKGGVYNVFSQGNVKHLSNATFLNLQSIGLLFVQFPPTLWGIVLISIGYWLWRSFFISREKKMRLSLLGKNASIAVPDSNFLRLLPLLLLIVIACGFIYSFFIANRSSDYYATSIYSIFLIPLIVSVTLVSFRFNTILPIYFAATFFPFLRISLAELHLSFTLIPLSIIFSLWAKDLFSYLVAISTERTWKITFALLLALFGIGLADHFLNIPAAALAQKRMVETNKAMAAWLKNNTPMHSIVVTNFYNFTDVFYYSNYHFDPYETVENCPMGPTQVVHNNKDFENLLNKNLGIRDVYLLASEHEFRDSSSKYYHSHKYVRNPPGEIEKLAEFSAKTTYYYIDPIKYFVPRYFVSFIGYMDWSIDFYYDNTSTLFKRIVYADYLLYKLKDISKGFNADERPQPSVGAPPHLAGVYQEYNIVDYRGSFYAVPQSLGTLDLSKEEDRKHKEIVVGKDRMEIERLIDKAIQSMPKVQPKVKAVDHLPHLAGSYQGYNIVDYKGRFYAVPQSVGSLDLSKEEDRKHKEIVISKDRKETERLIDKAIQSRPKSQPKVKAVDQPPHLAGSYQGYNIVDYKGSFYAVPQSVGSLDLSKEENKNRAGLLIGKERKEVEQMIDKAILNQEKAADLSPRLVRSYKGYNIVEYNNRFYGVPQSLGTLDLHKEEDRNRDGILIGKDVKEVKTLIKKHLGYFLSFYWKIKDVFNKK